MKYKLKTNINIQEGFLKGILESRGIENVESFLNLNESALYDSLLLNDIHEGAISLLQAIKNKKKFFIQVDSDTDGFSSAAIIYLYLKHLDPNVDISWRVHDGKQHGVIFDTIPLDADIILIPDAGSNQFEEHFELSELGKTVICLDHHIIDEVIPSKVKNVFIINNQLNNYPNPSLSGAGVTYKFCKYIDSLLNDNYAEKLIDLAALGIVADMMLLTNIETNYIVQKGLDQVQNPVFKTFIKLQEYSLKGSITPIGVSFYIAPYINGLIRVGSKEDKEILFSAFISPESSIVPSTKRGASGSDIEILSEQAFRLCKNAKSRQTKLRDNIIEKLSMRISKYDLLSNRILCITTDIIDDEENIENSLTGLVAIQLMNHYKLPTIILRDADDYWKGSARGPNILDFPDFKQFCLDSGFCKLAQGHANAFGIWINKNNLDKFISYCNEKLKDIDFEDSTYEVDYVFDKNYNPEEAINELAEHSKLWGRGLEEPQFIIKDITINKKDIQILGKTTKDTVKFSWQGIDYIKFKAASFINEFRELPYDTINLILLGRVNLNEYMGIVTPQIIFNDYTMTSIENFF